PELVVVVESPVSEQRMHDMFEMVNSVLRTHAAVGEYNQRIQGGLAGPIRQARTDTEFD
ncbi:phosphomannomutase/phosphoglucomutase, partial [Bradyrhizobium japonicum SEMIA 5079]|nr:phosphomannomutase/phosphoglucomutase [Bradyrhizobium japonicum SEMIA 5079]